MVLLYTFVFIYITIICGEASTHLYGEGQNFFKLLKDFFMLSISMGNWIDHKVFCNKYKNCFIKSKAKWYRYIQLLKTISLHIHCFNKFIPSLTCGAIRRQQQLWLKNLADQTLYSNFGRHKFIFKLHKIKSFEKN